MLYTLCLIALMQLLSVTSVLAADQVFYLGGTIGQADDDLLAEEETGVKVIGGFRVNKYFSVEAAAVGFGEYADETVQGGLEFSLVGFLPLKDKSALFAKAGVFIWNVDSDGSVKQDDEGADFMYGAGIDIGLTQRFVLRVEYDKYEDVSNGDIEFVSAGIIYYFE